ncbi:MAG: tetratricopeptide repeat protein [Phycisphaerales bacterium]
MTEDFVPGSDEREKPTDLDLTMSHIDGVRPDHAASIEHPGQAINQYTLVSLLGEGGFGTVWLADQHEPVRRQVALKIIKLGMDTRQVIARFEAERQALAVMDHPNIAKVFDAGTTETGRPYFVMEYAEGVTFTNYCNDQKLDIKERLQLFQRVCLAVQHAHQKGIIHRDIKPSNVIVTSVDGEHTPKVIDFGIAKATEARETEHSMFTELGQIIGTPAYMSPEQAGLTNEDIDTRSDVYALGVLLYEAMTGETPFDTKTLLRAGMEEIRRVIREVDPPKPSTRLTASKEDLASIAHDRDTEPRRLCTLVTGDIDWIVMKALDKDRSRRYQTATGLAEDIGRYLNNEPVTASPPSASYRTAKFVKRNKVGVFAAGFVLLALFIGTVGTTIGFVRAKRAESIAQQSAAEASHARELESQQRLLADQRAEEARIERDKAQQVAGFLTDMLSGVGAQVAQGADTTLLRGILEKTAIRIGDELAEQPAIEAEIRSNLGLTYLQIRDFMRAEENLLRASELFRSLEDGDHPDIAQSLTNLGQLREAEAKPAEAVIFKREALSMRERLAGPDSIHIPRSKMDLANTLVRLNEFEEAEELLLSVLDSNELIPGENHEEVGVVYNSLANLMQHLNEPERAEQYYRQALAVHREGLGDDHPFVATDLHNLGSLLSVVGQNREAIEVHEESLARCRALYPDGHEMTASNLVHLATLYRFSDERSSEAPEMLQEAISIQSKIYGEDSSIVARSYYDLGVILSSQKDHEGAIVQFQRSVDLNSALEGEQSQAVAVSMQSIARALGDLNRYEEATAVYDRVMDIQIGLFGESHPEPAITLVNIGAMHRQAENYPAAETALLRALEIFEAADRGTTSSTAGVYENLGRIYRAVDRLDESADVLRKALEIRKIVNGPNSRNTLGACYVFAGTLIEIGGYDEAETLLLHALDDPEGVINARIHYFIQRRYADLLFATERFDECIENLEECYQGFIESGSADTVKETLMELVRATDRRNELDPTPENEEAAIKWRQVLEEQG